MLVDVTLLVLSHLLFEELSIIKIILLSFLKLLPAPGVSCLQVSIVLLSFFLVSGFFLLVSNLFVLHLLDLGLFCDHEVLLTLGVPFVKFFGNFSVSLLQLVLDPLVEALVGIFINPNVLEFVVDEVYSLVLPYNGIIGSMSLLLEDRVHEVVVTGDDLFFLEAGGFHLLFIDG